MSKAFDKYRYGLLKIDVTDTYPLADIFDEEKYVDCIRSNNVEELLNYSIINFSKDNPGMNTYAEWKTQAEKGGFEYELVHPHGVLFRSSLTLLPGVMGAMHLIRLHHAGQVRKGDGFPYLEHPLAVGYRLWKGSFPIEVVIAGFCHDLLEDTDCKEEVIVQRCGQEVLDIVKAVSNDESLSDKKDWEKKKEKYVKSVVRGGEKAMAVCVMDKICNIQSFLDQYELEGKELWSKFNRGKVKKLWFERLVLESVKEHWDHPLVDEYERSIEKLAKVE